VFSAQGALLDAAFDDVVDRSHRCQHGMALVVVLMRPIPPYKEQVFEAVKIVPDLLNLVYDPKYAGSPWARESRQASRSSPGSVIPEQQSDRDESRYVRPSLTLLTLCGTKASRERINSSKGILEKKCRRRRYAFHLFPPKLDSLESAPLSAATNSALRHQRAAFTRATRAIVIFPAQQTYGHCESAA
jgi:hypothetical protein